MGELKASGQEGMKHSYCEDTGGCWRLLFYVRAEIDFMSVAWLQLNPHPLHKFMVSYDIISRGVDCFPYK
jgi:hypothetical protein